MKVLYTAEATATGGRAGHVRSSDGVLDLELAVPEGMGGPGGPATNPEQLFAAGYAACFDNAMIRVGERLRLSTAGARTTARVGIGAAGDGRPGFGLTVELLVVLPEVPDDGDAQRLLEATHERCPYSRATRGNVDVTVRLVRPVEVD